MEKSADAFRTISEVAEELDLPQHVLRFWETRFSQIRPLKRGGGRRYYRPEDLELLQGIRHLLYGEGYTIKGVQRILREQGVRAVMDVWKEGGGVILPSAGGHVTPVGVAEAAPAAHVAPAPVAEPHYEAAEAYTEPVYVRDTSNADVWEQEPAADYPQQVELWNEQQELDDDEPDGPLPAGLLPDDEPEGAGQSGSFSFMDRIIGHEKEQVGGKDKLSKEDVRRLQSTLFELLECKRMLDQAR